MLLGYVVALGGLGVLCGLIRYRSSGRWTFTRGAGLLTLALLVLGFGATSNPGLWSALADAGTGFLLLVFWFGPVVVGADLWWRKGGLLRLISLFLVTLCLAFFSAALVHPVWERWNVCLPPAGYYGPENGGPECTLKP